MAGGCCRVDGRGAVCCVCVYMCMCVFFFCTVSPGGETEGKKIRDHKKKPCQFLSHPSPTAKSPEGIRVCVCESERERRVEK